MGALLRRLGVYLLAAWVALTVSFLLPRVVPGNPVAGAVARASQSGNCNSVCVHAIEEQLGYNVHTSLWDQYVSTSEISPKAISGTRGPKTRRWAASSSSTSHG